MGGRFHEIRHWTGSGEDGRVVSRMVVGRGWDGRERARLGALIVSLAAIHRASTRIIAALLELQLWWNPRPNRMVRFLIPEFVFLQVLN